MQTLVIFAHPVRTSFCGAVADALIAGITEGGGSVELADLYREEFNSHLGAADLAQFQGGAMPEDVQAEQARVDRADAIAFVFPVWWWSFPAILKGWIDRVFSEGWAYSFAPSRSRGLLRDRPVLLLATGGSRESTWRKYGYDSAMRTQIDLGILGYCGLRDVETKLFFDVEESAETRQTYLEESRRLGRALISPDRTPRTAAESSDRPA